jgi:hypothetical protein
VKIVRVDVYLRARSLLQGAVLDAPLELYADEQGAGPDLLAQNPLTAVEALNRIHFASAIPPTPLPPGRWLHRIAGTAVPAFLARTVTVEGVSYRHLAADALEDIYLVCHYQPA